MYKSKLMQTASQLASIDTPFSKAEVPRLFAINCTLDGVFDLRQRPSQVKQKYALLHGALTDLGVLQSEKKRRTIESVLAHRRAFIPNLENYMQGIVIRFG